MKIDDDIELAIMDIRQYVKPDEMLYIAPATTNLRCFVPCQKGHCICRATVEGNWCVVTKAGYDHAKQVFQSSLDYLQKRVESIDEKLKEED